MAISEMNGQGWRASKESQAIY